MIVIMDTNVPLVANENAAQASPDCILSCIKWIRHITSDQDLIALDDGWRIIKEYQNELRSEGEPGIGDAFLKWVLTNVENPRRCHKVAITQKNNSEDDFQEFPDDPALKDFDRSDRKFVAVAIKHPKHPKILNAWDTDWLIFTRLYPIPARKAGWDWIKSSKRANC
jgi:hypothetical protein